MIAWQHILCAVTFTAGIIDTVAIYKFYAPQIFLHSEAATASNLVHGKKSLDDISTRYKKNSVNHPRSLPPSHTPSDIPTPDETSLSNEPGSTRKVAEIGDANLDLAFTDSDDLVLDVDQADVDPKENEAIPTQKGEMGNAIIEDSPPSMIPAPSDDSLQSANDLAIAKSDNTPPAETPAFVFLFRKNVAELNWRDESKLRKHIRSLRENDLITIRLVGFADPSGSKTYNYYLGLKRARNVARFLSKRGVPRSRIQIVSSGEIDETSEAVRSNIHDMNQRRRVEVYFTEKDESTDE